MQKGEKNKLKLLLIGIQARLKQNRDYFVSAEFIFKSGNKKFKAALKAGEENDYLLVFQGTERPIDAEEVVSFFDKQTELYDDSTLVYTERGYRYYHYGQCKGCIYEADRAASCSAGCRSRQ